MAKGKSRSIDGLTSEVFCSCWHFIEDDSLTLSCISETRVSCTFNQGVLKLVPKKAD